MTTIDLPKENFYKKLLSLAFPMFLAQLFANMLAIIDTFMVSSIGDNAVTAVGIGSQIYFFLSMMLFGLFSGFGIFIAQYYGAKEYHNVYKVYLTMLSIGVIIALLFVLVSQTLPSQIIGMFLNSNNPDNASVLAMGVGYYKIIGFAFFFSTISFSLSMLARGVHKVLVVNIIQIFGVGLNTFLNWILINGNLGSKAYGVQGAAYATLISSVVMFIGYMIYITLSKEQAFKIKFRYYKDITRDFLKRLFKRSIPVFFNETFWGLGMTMYLVAYGFIGPNAQASVHVSNQINGLFWVATIAVANAAAVMIGKKLGENDLETAVEWESKFIRVGLFLGVSLGIILYFISPNIAGLFKGLTDDVKVNMIKILKVYAIYAPIKFLNAIYIVGSLRAGGDTLFTMLAEIIPLWVIGVGLAFTLSITTSLPLYIIVILVNIEELTKLVILRFRSKSKKWVKNLTLEQSM